MGKTDPDAPRHAQQSMILVPIDAPGVKVVRHLPVFGFDHAPHGHAEIIFEQVRVPVANLLLGEGRGFEIAQGRLGPGRVHHCMRLIGLAERALEMMCRRTRVRVTFGKPIAEQTVTLERIAEARILIDQARLLVLQTARTMDSEGNKVAAKQIAMIKVAVPNMATRVIDWAIQAYGGGGVADPFLAGAYACGSRATAGGRARRGASQPDRQDGAGKPSRQRIAENQTLEPVSPVVRVAIPDRRGLAGAGRRRRRAKADPGAPRAPGPLLASKRFMRLPIQIDARLPD